jgi:hypothetical protein
VRGESLMGAHLGREVLIGWGRLLGLVGLVLAGVIGVLVVLAVLVAALALAGIDLTAVVLFAMNVGLLWVSFYLFFAAAAIAVSRVGPLAAIRYSVAIVRRNFWSSLGLILLKFVITYGLQVVLAAIARFPIGAPVAIVASAYIGTGLEAAVLLFYRERLARWQQQRVSAVGMPRPGAPR